MTRAAYSNSNTDVSAACGGTALIVFARAPEPGRAKTRLVPALGVEGAAELARRMLDHALATACATDASEVELCVTPDRPGEAVSAIAAHHCVALTPQGDGDLGARMHRALSRRLLTRPRALLFGTDAPTLDVESLRVAAAALETHDAVCIPAFDGGYVLIGARRPIPELFLSMPWSTSQVMSLTRERARAAGMSLRELPPLADVDQPADLRHVSAHMLHGLHVASSPSR